MDVPGEGPFDGLIADLGRLEFWTRDSDLGAGDFDRVWALMR
jgi:hypothetical protein